MLRSLIAVGERLSGKEYKTDADVLTSRCASSLTTAVPVTFMIADGILPSNEGRGLRAAPLAAPRHPEGAHGGHRRRSSTRYVDEIVKLMGDVYPEIVDNREPHSPRHSFLKRSASARPFARTR